MVRSCLIVEVPKYMVRRLRGGHRAVDGVRRAQPQVHRALPTDPRYRLWAGCTGVVTPGTPTDHPQADLVAEVWHSVHLALVLAGVC